MFFSEEKNQKTFTFPPLPPYPAMAGRLELAPKLKVFWFFSSEKNSLSCLPDIASPVSPDYASFAQL
jgi:hypothetical protein